MFIPKYPAIALVPIFLKIFQLVQCHPQLLQFSPSALTLTAPQRPKSPDTPTRPFTITFNKSNLLRTTPTTTTSTTTPKPRPSSDSPQVSLKRRPGETRDYNSQKSKSHSQHVLTEEECTQTMFMSPYHYPVKFSVNSSIYSRMDKTCKWKFIGTEPCIPKISCETTHLTRECDKEFLEIVDGGLGYMKVCDGNYKKVVNVSAADGLRDLFIHFRVNRGSRNTSKTLFSCTVVCSRRGEGKPLEKSFTLKRNPKCFCGTKPNEDRIVGGETAKKFEFPWLVALVETNTRQPFCGGSIINNRFIITAAHCIQGKFLDYRNIQVVVNGHEFDSSPNHAVNYGPPIPPRYYPLKDLEKMDRRNGSKRYNLEEIMIHPLYVIETNDYDIALLKLQEDIDLNPKTRTKAAETSGPDDPYLQQPRAICLPELGSYERTYSNKKAIIAGWGLNSHDALGTMQTLQKLEVKVFSPQVCKEIYAHRVNRRMMCAGHREGGKDSCSGDSGGPLVTEETAKVWTQIGSVSWGEGCGEVGHPGVYFRITEGVQWIQYNSNFNGQRQEDEAGEGWEEKRSAVWCVTPQQVH